MLLTIEIPDIEPKLVLQISFKVINNSIGPNGLVFTLLLFSTYLKMTELDALPFSITQHDIVIKNTINEI